MTSRLTSVTSRLTSRVTSNLQISRDGSSPLACMSADNGRYYLFGHIAWDGECDEGAEPHVYTNVASLFSWIRDNYGRMARELPPQVTQR